INSQAVIANAWHHRSDALSSIGTLIGIGGAIILGSKWTILDPIAGVVVSVFIIKVAIQISLESINQLLECSLTLEEKEKLLKLINSVEGVKDPHRLKTRKIGNNIAVDIHIRVNPRLTVSESHSIATQIENKIIEEYGNESFILVHVEPEKSHELESI
ncbi:MAG TPA: cation diffusion facilitator family transporter, partial [Spirochaetota bacterium]|nr:cation diffusion facilitator family transporter [Spirochaetota bacterium]